MTKNRVMMVDLETSVPGAVSPGCSDALMRTQERHRAMLGVLTNLLIQAQAGVHEEECNAAKMNQNNQACEDLAFSKLLFACCEHQRRVMAKNQVMMVDMEALGPRGVALDLLDALKKTQERHRVLLDLLVNLFFQAKDGVREEQANAIKMNEFN